MLTIAILLTFSGTTIAVQDLAPGAQAAVLLDGNSGRILFEKNSNTRLPIASITKVMTAILAIESGGDLDKLVTIGPNAVGVEGSSIYLKQGEKVPLRSLLYGLMLRSGNDAATAIAEYVGGSVPGFVYMMNQKARELGMNNTHFANPSGLDASDHYSTARDMAVLASYAMKNPTFKEIVSSKSKSVTWPSEPSGKRLFYNKNKLLSMYPGANGVKTGFTKKAHRTLIGGANKNGRQLITVTLNDGNDWKDHISMFNYGFNQFGITTILNEAQALNLTDPMLNRLKNRYNFLTAQRFDFALSSEELYALELKSNITHPIQAIKDGMRIGNVHVYLNNKIIGLVPIVAQDTSTLSYKLNQLFSSLLGYLR